MGKFFLLLFFVAGSAFASDFNNRVSAGKEAMKQPLVREYLAKLDGHIAVAMGSCFAGKATQERGFVLVATVLPHGSVTDVEVHPHSAGAQCFAESIRRAPMPAFPSDIDRPSGLPITVDMRVGQ